MNTKKHSGFTLIELLVVISVIGVLASIVLVSFGGTQKRARDTQRMSDLKQYQTLVENFANQNNGLFPSRATAPAASITLCADLGLTGCTEDPRYDDDASYIYRYHSDGPGGGIAVATTYVLWGKLENVSTTTYWVLCSNGKVGEAESGLPPSGGACPI